MKLNIINLAPENNLFFNQLMFLANLFNYHSILYEITAEPSASAVNILLTSFSNADEVEYFVEFASNYSKKFIIIATHYLEQIIDFSRSQINTQQVKNFLRLFPHIRAFATLGLSRLPAELYSLAPEHQIVNFPLPLFIENEKFDASFQDIKNILFSSPAYLPITHSKNNFSQQNYTILTELDMEWQEISPAKLSTSLYLKKILLFNEAKLNSPYTAYAYFANDEQLIQFISEMNINIFNKIYINQLKSYIELANQQNKTTSIIDVISLWSLLEESYETL